MKVLIVFNHPFSGSFCNALLDSVSKGLIEGGHDIDVIHLDNDNFDPVMREKDLKAFVDVTKSPEVLNTLDPKVLDYSSRLLAADHLIFIFPIWWELMPALTKGFIDKLIFPGIAYDYVGKPGASRMKSISNLKAVTLITTMNTPSIAYKLIFGNAIKKAVLTGTFWKIGIKKRNWISFDMVKMVSDTKRQKWLSGIETRFQALK